MRVDRFKNIRKFLRFYRIVFGLSAPFDVILDANFIYHAIKYKIDIFDRMKALLQNSDVRFYVTSSSIDELNLIGSKGAEALQFANSMCELIDDSAIKAELVQKQASIDSIENTGKKEKSEKSSGKQKKGKDGTVSSGEVLKAYLWASYRDWLTNPLDITSTTSENTSRRYMVATQDKALRNALGRIPGTPLFYLNNVSLVMEPVSIVSKEFNKELEMNKSGGKDKQGSKEDVEQVAGQKRARASKDDGERVEKGEKEEGKRAERVKHKAKAANPLSSKAAEDGSRKSKKAKVAKYKRR
jgi:U3 small nucleolar RNA-associated protein 23